MTKTRKSGFVLCFALAAGFLATTAKGKDAMLIPVSILETDFSPWVSRVAEINLAAERAQGLLEANYRSETETAFKLARLRAEEEIRKTAKALSTPGFLFDFVTVSVVDILEKSDKAGERVQAACERYCGVFEELETRLEAAARRLRSGLETVNQRYAAELGQFVTRQNGRVERWAGMAAGQFQQGFQRSVLINTAMLTVGAGFEVSQFRATRKALVRLARWLAKLLKPVIQKAAASVVPALADGPIPVGDIIAAVGLAWTVWDICSFRGSVEREALELLKKTAGEVLAEARQSAERCAAELSLEAAAERGKALDKAMAEARF